MRVDNEAVSVKCEVITEEELNANMAGVVGKDNPNVKPNPKYSPEGYDLSYVGIKSRTRNRKSIRRAVN